LEAVVFLLPLPLSVSPLLLLLRCSSPPVDPAPSPDISAMVSWGDGEESSTDFSSIGADVSLQYPDF
jgi:hypothetical protein